MNVWIVAAGGCVFQGLKNLTRGKQCWSNLSSKNIDLVGPESPGTSRPREQVSDKAFAAEMASTSGFEGENIAMLDNLGSWGAVSSSSSLDDIQGNESIVSSNSHEFITSDSYPQPLTREIGFRRNGSSLRSRRINSKVIKARTSLESCLMAQLYKEHGGIEEYTYTVDPPQKPIVRPFLVADGSRVISRVISPQSCSKQTGAGKCKLRKDDAHPHERDTVHGVPRLPEVVPVQLQKKVKDKTDDANKKTEDTALLFYLGLTMGILYSILGHKLEIEKLVKLLKQSENLVQDLQEELEMKDALTVKELAVEDDYESPGPDNDSSLDDAMNALSVEQKLDHSSSNCDDDCRDQNADDESLRKIEAELEAELDRLASNMNSSRLESKLSNLAEEDPDFVSDAIKGDLRVDLFGASTSTQAYADRDGSGSSTPSSPVRYPVSPRELSLKLHEVIQSRLEERVKELEAALDYSQRKIESQHTRSSYHGSPTPIDRLQSIDEPVVINLSGEALSAYNETYEELSKFCESDEDENDHEDIFHQHEQDVESVEDDDKDEMERLLIMQIVEKARQGSPAVLKAQKALLSNGEY